jgi:ankyrin repeat protein
VCLSFSLSLSQIVYNQLPLRLAAHAGHDAVCTFLIESGAQIDELACVRQSAAAAARAPSSGAPNSLTSVARLFLQLYPGVSETRSGDTALSAAIRENRVEPIKVLVTRGADVTKEVGDAAWRDVQAPICCVHTSGHMFSR